MDGSRSLRKSVRDQNGPTQYVNGYVREGNTRKSRTGDNHNGGPSSTSLRINTNFSPGKRKSKRYSGDQIDAMWAHCAGEQSPQSGVSWIRRNKAARTEAMAETPAPDDSVSETSRPHSTPMTSRITDFLRMLVGNLETPEEHEGVEYEEKRFDSSKDNNWPSLLSHDTSTRPAPASAETTQNTETLLSSDFPVRSSAAEGVTEENRGIAEAIPPSPLINLPINSLDEPRSPSGEQSTSQDGIDVKELPPLPLSAIDRPPTDPGAHTPIDSAPTAADAPTDCSDNDKKDNEANATAAEASSSSVNIDHPIAGDASPLAGSPSLNRNTNVDDVIEDASKTDQANSTSHTQSAPEIVHQSSAVSGGAEPVADESKSQSEHIQDESAASEAKETVETGKSEPEKTLQVPDTETETDQGAGGSTGDPLKETPRLIVLERVPDLVVSENEHPPADISKASSSSNTVEHEVDNPGSQTQEGNVGSSPAATETSGEGDETLTTSATANADGKHPEVPVLLITPPEPSSAVVVNDPASVNTASSPGPSPSSSLPPAESIVASGVPPPSTSPDGSSARDNSGNGSATATQDMNVTDLVSPSVNLQSSSPDESTLSGGNSGSQEVIDGRQLPYILALPFPFIMDFSLALSLKPTSDISTSTAEDRSKACNNNDVRPVKEVKLLTQQTTEVVPSPSIDTDRSITGSSSLTARASSPSPKNRNAKAGGPVRDKSAASRASSNPRTQSNSVQKTIPMDTDTKPLSGKAKRKAKKDKPTKAGGSTQDQGDTTAGEDTGEKKDLQESEQAVSSGFDVLPSTALGKKGKRGISKDSDEEVQDTYRLSVQDEASNPQVSESDCPGPTPRSRAAQTEGETSGSKRGANSSQAKSKTKEKEKEKEKARKKEQKAEQQKQRDKNGTNTKHNASSKKNKVRGVHDNFTDGEEVDLLNVDNDQGGPSGTKHVASQENAASNTPDLKAADSIPPAGTPTTDNPDPQASGSSSQEKQDTDILPSLNDHKPEASPSSKVTVSTGEKDRTHSTPQTSQSDSRGQVPTGDLLNLEDETEQTTVSSSAASTDIPLVTPCQTMEGSISPVLPELPDSLSGFSIILDFLQANTFDNPTESIAVSTPDLASPLEEQDLDAETVISPTRSLFPSMSQEFKNIDRSVTSLQGTKMSHAKAAELRIRNQQLEEQCDGWKKKYDELERRHRELEKKYRDLEKSLADAVEVGADWSNMNISH